MKDNIEDIIFMKSLYSGWSSGISAAVYTVGAGFLAGLCNGMIGCGGGVIIVYALSRLYENDPERTSRDVFASAVAAILPMSLTSTLLYTASGVDGSGAVKYIVPAVTGGIVGAYFLDKINQTFLRRLFGLLVMWAGVSLILRRAGIM